MTKKKEPTKQDILDNSLSIIKGYLQFCPEPTYKFNIGDSVSCGNLMNAVVTESLENGKIYRIEYDGNKGQPREENYFSWYQIRPITNNRTSIWHDTMRITFSPTSLSSLINDFTFFGIELNPPYQRDLIWDESDKVLLIDSIFHGIDIGKFVLVKRPFSTNEPTFEILDGKQRLSAIMDFYLNKLCYNGLYFNDLCPFDKGKFTDYSINIATLHEPTFEEILEAFIRLNTTGKVMDRATLDNAIALLKKENNMQ